MVITSNLLAMNAERMLGITSKDLKKRSEKLSSGYKVNRAADDAAGLAISEKMRRQIRGLNKSVENIQDGISLCQVADGALNEVHDILQRINELSVKAGNDTNTQTDREYIQMEIDALTEEIDRIANNTTFNEGIYPLLGKGSSSAISGSENLSGGILESRYLSGDMLRSSAVDSLSDSDYPGSNLQIVNASTISNYDSYTDSDGKIHYQLGSGTFKIEGLTNCVFDISGNTCIEDTNLKNVTINCSTGTVLSVKDVRVDNSENIYETGNGIGAAIQFHGSGNTLNCFGDNEFNGGVDNYTTFTDSYNNQPYHIACAGINVGSGTELTINGTNTSNLTAHGCAPSTSGNYISVSYGYEASVITSFGIGSNFHEDGGKITINSGHITAYASIEEKNDVGGCIGGGKDTTVTINGGTIDTYGGAYCIGGGDTIGDGGALMRSGSAHITINGGTINAASQAVGAVIGYRGTGTIDINGGTVTAIATGSNVALGGSFIGSCGVINITGGTVIATATGEKAAAIGTCEQGTGGRVNITGGKITATAHENSKAVGEGWQSSPVDVYVDGVKADASGIKDGKGHIIYTYPNSTGETDGNEGSNPGDDEGDNSGNSGGSNSGNNAGSNSSINLGIWIHMATEPGVGMFITLVDATKKGLGIGVLDVSSMENAGKAINSVKHALGKVSEYRTVFGAQQNRLEHAVNINENIVENTTAAESRIRDTDIATEIMEHTKDSILQQAGVSILTQANQMPQYALQLLS